MGHLHAQLPELIPLNRSKVEAIVAKLEPYQFDSIFGAWWDLVLRGDGKAALRVPPRATSKRSRISIENRNSLTGKVGGAEGGASSSRPEPRLLGQGSSSRKSYKKEKRRPRRHGRRKFRIVPAYWAGAISVAAMEASSKVTFTCWPTWSDAASTEAGSL